MDGRLQVVRPVCDYMVLRTLRRLIGPVLRVGTFGGAFSEDDAMALARILDTVGGWLKARDPQAAQPFYQKLVIKCDQAELSRAVRREHWLSPPAAKPAEL